MRSLERTEISGVPVLLIPDNETFCGGLTFRVGAVDETMATAGITRLVKHLVMSSVEEPPVECNARVELTETTFFASGSARHVVSFLEHVGTALRDLPIARLELERSVLQIEDDGDSGNVLAEFLSLRYGAHAYGLAKSRQFGTTWLDDEAVRAWAQTYFTAGNAVAWFSGPVPAALDLSLPSGVRVPIPEARPAVERLPAVARLEEERGVGLSVLASRSVALAAATRILDRRIRRRLRHDLGLSSIVDFDYTPLSAGLAHVAIVADCRADEQREARDEFLTVVKEFPSHPPTGFERAYDLEWLTERAGDDGETIEWLQQAASEELAGLTPRAPGSAVAQLRATSSAGIAAMWKEALDSALLLVGGKAGDSPAGFVDYRPQQATPLKGRKWFPRPAVLLGVGWSTRLLAGDQGVTLDPHGERPISVRYDDCAIFARWSNGDRVLIGGDGQVLPFRPRHWLRGRQLASLLEERIPPECVVQADDLMASPLVSDEIATNPGIRLSPP